MQTKQQRNELINTNRSRSVFFSEKKETPFQSTINIIFKQRNLNCHFQKISHGTQIFE